MLFYGIVIGIIVLVVLIVILAIIKNNRGQQYQAHNSQLEAASFNSLLESELSNGTDGESLIEILGLENLPVDGQKEIIEAATRVIEKRCLNRILESLDEEEKQDFINTLDQERPEVIQDFLKSKHLDPSSILREEVLRFKEETADKFS